MSHVLTFDESRDSLAEVISSKNVLLVLGAGASVTSGAPIGRELVDRLAKRFPQAEIQSSTLLFDACREIEDTPAYGRQDLIQFVHQLLAELTPSESYQQLPRIRWRALFTTNYDDLIEKAYQSPARSQTLQPVPLEFGAALVARDNHVLLHYLMGSVKEPYQSAGAPVLTWADFTQTLQGRAPIMQLFQNVLADGGKVIYVGYSFNDLVFESILDEAVRRVGHRNVPYGHAILTEWPQDRKRGFQRISTRQVIPVEGTFEDLAKLLRELADGGLSTATSPLTAPSSPAAGKTLSLPGRVLKLSESEAAVYSEAFEVLDDSAAYTPSLSVEEMDRLARSFFRGETQGWGAFALGIPFQRPSYMKIESTVVQHCNRQNRDEPIVLVHGPAALGKSIMSRQLAFDLFTKHAVPVVIAKATWRARPDLKLVDRLFDDLEAGLPEREALAPLVLIVDEAELLDRSVPRRLLSYLKVRQRQCVIVLFARTNEYFRQNKGSDSHDSVSIEHAFSISDKIEKQEVRDLIAHLTRIGLWNPKRITSDDFWQEQVATLWNSSFFDTVYSLVEETQVPLRERVWSEFEQLSAPAKEAYLLIAAVHQFGIPMKMEILMRALALDFATFEREIIRSDARDVLFTEHATGELNIYFRGRTRLISQLVFERSCPTPGAQLPAFIQFVRGVNPSEMYGLDELDALRTLLVQVFGPSGYDSRFSTIELAELFGEATKIVDDDVLEHHFGIVEKEAGHLLSAQEHLARALELSRTLPFDLASFRESPQNIENSLANVIGLLAQESLKRGNVAAADRLFDEARAHFISARSGAFPNAAAYDAHARMLFTRAKRLFAEGSADRALSLCEVLDVISEGLDNVNVEYRASLLELQTEVMGELGLYQEASDELIKRAETAAPRERSRYEVLLARLALRGPMSSAKKKHLHSALVFSVRACEHDPQYFAAWKLRAELYQVLHPTETRELIEYLEAASRCPDSSGNAWLWYELAVAYFTAGTYEKCASAFAKLRRVAAGHGRAAGVIERGGEREGGDPFEFTGRVVRREARGGFIIRCDDLAALGELYFNVRGERFYTARVGDLVSFVAGFNYRGVVALEVKRL